jgi:hypothetical protein
MLKHDWEALRALKHIRQFRPVEVNNTRSRGEDNR